MRIAPLSTAPLLAALALTASCVGPPSNLPVVQPAPAPPPPRVVVATPAPAPLATDWRDWPLTPGDWTYVATPRGGIARFGPAGAPLFALECDHTARRIYLERMQPITGPMTVRTSSVSRTIVTTLTGSPPIATAPLPATDSLLDAMGFSRGRFAVDQPGAPPIVMPAYAEVELVVDACRG